MNFSEALNVMKAGHKVSRRIWPTNAYLYLVVGGEFTVTREPLKTILGEGAKATYSSHIDCFDGDVFTPYFFAQTDVLADDWYIQI